MSESVMVSGRDSALARVVDYYPTLNAPSRVSVDPARTTDAPKARVDILIVDDDPAIRTNCARLLRQEGYDVSVCSRGQEAVDLLARKKFSIVLADLHLPQVDGLAVLKAARTSNPKAVVIMMTSTPTVEASVEVLRRGAWDYLPKPFSATQLQILVGRAAHAAASIEPAVALATPTPPIRPRARNTPPEAQRPELLGNSPAFRRMLTLASKVAASDASVFITGESGAGKELIARFIHDHSRRAQQTFIAVNCAAMPEPLLESEMFGHRKGAFTDAVRDKAGLMEAAHGGTLFLDELGEMGGAMQAKLLRVIQDGVVRRVGSETVDAVVNIRFIAATNRSPEQAVEAGTLREDLLYRLRVVPIHVPPLRERPEDIALLAEHFVRHFWERHRAGSGSPPRLTASAIRQLERHPWPGNVRELQNVIEHAVVLADSSSWIDAQDLDLVNGTVSSEPAHKTPSFVPGRVEEGYHAARERIVSEFEIRYLMWLLQHAGGNMARAARIAGVDRNTLYRMLDRHKLCRSPGASVLVPQQPNDARSVTEVPALSVQAGGMR